MKKNKVIILVVMISLLLCSSFAVAGLSDMLTGKFSFGNLFNLKKENVQPIVEVQPIVVAPNCGDGTCVAGESPESCPEDCEDEDLEIVYADKIESRNGDNVQVNDNLKVISSGSGLVPSAIVGTHAENLNKGYLGVQEYGVLGTHGSTPGNWGYLGGEDYGAYGENEGNDNFGYLGGASVGVNGFSSSGSGVKGTSLGGGGIGVWGVSDSGKAMHAYASGSATYALHAQSVASDGVALLAQTLSSTGYSGLFTGGQGVKIYNGGLCVDVDSNCDPDASGKGWIRARGYWTGNGDIAEYMPSQEKLEAGDVVVINLKNSENILKSSKAYDKAVAGIVSTKPGVTLGKETDGNLLALAGRVPTKVSAENGPIEIGDLLTTSSTSGHAMKCTDMQKCFGALVGKALEPLNKGTGKIIVLVTLG